MKIRIAGTELGLNNKSMEIYIQGCYRHCSGCHNPETQSFDGGKEVDIIPYLTKLSAKVSNIPIIKRIFVSGGDLLCQTPEVAKEFSRTLRQVFPKKQLWLFTGEDDKDKVKHSEIAQYYDVIKLGRYDERFKQDAFPASTNQVLLYRKRAVFDRVVLSFKGHREEM